MYNSFGIEPRLSVPVIIVSFLLLGRAFFLALLYYAVFLHRLMAEGHSAGPRMATIVMTVGPLGQFATAIQLLGTVASEEGAFGGYGKDTFLTDQAASSVAAVCVRWSLYSWWDLLFCALLWRGISSLRDS